MHVAVTSVSFSITLVQLLQTRKITLAITKFVFVQWMESLHLGAAGVTAVELVVLATRREQDPAQALHNEGRDKTVLEVTMRGDRVISP